MVPALDAARAAGIPVLPATVITGTRGRLRVIGRRARHARGGWLGLTGEIDRLRLVLMAGGWTPSVHLFSQSRGKLRFDEARQVFLPGKSAQAQRSAGACNGTFGIAASLDEGAEAGEAAASDAGMTVAEMAVDSSGAAIVAGEIAASGGWHGAVPHHRDPQSVKAFVDFQNDVTAKDIGLAVREGFRSIEHVKRYTTNGMATDQGKTSNMNGLAIAAGILGKAIPEVGLTTFRPPYTPVTFGSFAGHSRGQLFDPIRRTPTHRLGREPRRGVRGCRPVEARLVLPQGGRGHARRRGARMPCRARQRRHLRRLDARQDRGGRPRCRRVHEPALHQPLEQARARAAAATA